jgi:cell division protease FtsH
MVMDYGMSRLGRVNYRESSRSPFLAGSGDFPRERSHSEQTAREIDEEITRIIVDALGRVRQILNARRPALIGLAARLIEREVIDADELRQIVEENSPSPQIVPGTVTAKRPPVKEHSIEPAEDAQQQAGGS